MRNILLRNPINWSSFSVVIDDDVCTKIIFKVRLLALRNHSRYWITNEPNFKQIRYNIKIFLVEHLVHHSPNWAQAVNIYSLHLLLCKYLTASGTLQRVTRGKYEGPDWMARHLTHYCDHRHVFSAPLSVQLTPFDGRPSKDHESHPSAAGDANGSVLTRIDYTTKKKEEHSLAIRVR